ncbi:MAG: hypothetical protein LBH97_00350 [Treponema sp.]|jgi:hypothetical protein|nr:hypothetical protein [Treponema sp.]
MTFIRSVLALLLLSLLGGAGLLALGTMLIPSWQYGGYAVLICNEAVPDRDLRERLAFRGLGESLISESSQWVLLDAFGGLEQVPLDIYPSRILPFDPRNDGYAERLRSFFVRDGKRLVFIPRGAVSPGSLEKRIAAAIEGIPHTVEHLGLGKPLGLFFVFFGLALCILLPLRLLKSRPLPRMGQFLPCLPILAALVLDGAWGFVLAAILAGFFALLREPVLEWLAMLRYSRRRGQQTPSPETADIRQRFFSDVYEPFKSRWLFSLLLLLCYPLICVFSKISPLMAAAIIIMFAGIMIFSLQVFSQPRIRDYIRFSPVPLLKPPFGFSFLWVMFPFGLAAILAAIIPLFWTGSPSLGAAAVAGEIIITENEYQTHAAFQSSFSRRSLDQKDRIPGQAGYAAYILDDDGLVSPAPFSPMETTVLSTDIPPFPLKHLMHFLAAAVPGRN